MEENNSFFASVANFAFHTGKFHVSCYLGIAGKKEEKFHSPILGSVPTATRNKHAEVSLDYSDNFCIVRNDKFLDFLRAAENHFDQHGNFDDFSWDAPPES